MPKTPKIVAVATETLRPRPQNARTHSKKQLRKIADSIRQFGFLNPVLVDRASVIVAGHARVEAAKLIGLGRVPTITVDHLSPEEIRAYVIADNKLAAEAGWDRELLALELSEIAELAPDLDLTITGFEIEEIELLGDIRPSSKAAAEPSISDPDRDKPAVTRLADIWEIGRHRLFCGSALEHKSYTRLLRAERADLVITDPPYNVPIAGHVSTHSRPEFLMASGEMTRAEFQRFLADACSNLAKFSRAGSLHYIFMDWRSIADLLSAGEEVYDQLLNIIVWAKPNGGMGSFYRSRHELVALFKRGTRAHTNNVELGAKNGRYRTNVWEYPGANTFGGGRRGDLALHPTVKNLDMIVDAIKDASRPNELVLDPFGGSGTTLLAAERCGRTSRLIELDPYYCDTILRRALKAGLKTSLAATGESFDDVEGSRTNQLQVLSPE